MNILTWTPAAFAIHAAVAVPVPVFALLSYYLLTVRRRGRRATRTAGVAFGLLAAVWFLNVLLRLGLGERVMAAGVSTEDYIAVTNSLFCMVQFVGLALLIWAVRADRKPDEAR
jgi:hypothetical protein